MNVAGGGARSTLQFQFLCYIDRHLKNARCVFKPLEQNTRVCGVIIPNSVIPRNTFVIEIDACKNPMFLFDIDRNKHFGASKDVSGVFGLHPCVVRPEHSSKSKER
jgi:hypothetical protein